MGQDKPQGDGRNGPVSLKPLTFEEALDGLLRTPLTPEEKRPPKEDPPHPRRKRCQSPQD